MSEEKPSERLVEQRCRNRIMEALQYLSQGDDGVRSRYSPAEWIEEFFDWFPYEGEPDWYPAMTEDEATKVRTVCKVMQLVILDRAMPKGLTTEQIIDSGWPANVAPVAKSALDVMLARGRFSEEAEEDEPSNLEPWPIR